MSFARFDQKKFIHFSVPKLELFQKFQTIYQVSNAQLHTTYGALRSIKNRK
jgi:hypothetical protein